MTILLRRLGVLLMAVLSGCAGLLEQPEETPLPISANTAVVALIDSARMDFISGKSDSAGATIERALRIEPKNPMLWHELAKLRLREGEFKQAEALAAKSNNWADENKRLRVLNWRIIGDARERLGNFAGANAAYDKATELENN
jgi:Flp pilus assembly protein TadD